MCNKLISPTPYRIPYVKPFLLLLKQSPATLTSLPNSSSPAAINQHYSLTQLFPANISFVSTEICRIMETLGLISPLSLKIKETKEASGLGSKIPPLSESEMGGLATPQGTDTGRSPSQRPPSPPLTANEQRGRALLKRKSVFGNFLNNRNDVSSTVAYLCQMLIFLLVLEQPCRARTTDHTLGLSTQRDEMDANGLCDRTEKAHPQCSFLGNRVQMEGSLASDRANADTESPPAEERAPR